MSTGQQHVDARVKRKCEVVRVEMHLLLVTSTKIYMWSFYEDIHTYVLQACYVQVTILAPILFVMACLFLTNYHLSLSTVIPTCMWVSS